MREGGCAGTGKARGSHPHDKSRVMGMRNVTFDHSRELLDLAAQASSRRSRRVQRAIEIGPT